MNCHQFVRRRTGSANLADDVVQDTWVRAITVSAAMPQNAKAYVFRMAGNLAMDHIRRERGRSQHEGHGDHLSEAIASGAATLEAELAAQQELAILAAAVRELPAKRRRIFILYRGYDLTMRQIAERLGLSEKTVENHIARAMVHCRQRLQDAGRDI
jgi:RNA polymerase sigma-70 factor (ECF subfamily)